MFLVHLNGFYTHLNAITIEKVLLNIVYSGVPASSKTNIYNFQSYPGMQEHFEPVLVNSWCSVGKQITVTFTFTFKFTFTMEGNVKSE